MPLHSLPTNVGSGTSTGHYAHTNAVHAFLNKFDTTTGSAGANGVWVGAGLEVAGALITYVPVLTETGTAYTVGWPGLCRVVTLSNASPITVTVPTNATDALPIGYSITLVQYGVGQVTVAPAGGVTVNATPGLKLLDQFASAQLLKMATNTWLMIGRLSV